MNCWRQKKNGLQNVWCVNNRENKMIETKTVLAGDTIFIITMTDGQVSLVKVLKNGKSAGCYKKADDMPKEDKNKLFFAQVTDAALARWNNKKSLQK